MPFLSPFIFALQKKMGQIKTVKTYPAIYNECSIMAREEQIRNARPALSDSVGNMAQYGTIFLCSPNWWRTLPMGVFTFLESYDFSGKKIYPLIDERSEIATVLARA
jgi:hypothetical protein